MLGREWAAIVGLWPAWLLGASLILAAVLYMLGERRNTPVRKEHR